MAEVYFNKMLSLYGRWEVMEDGRVAKFAGGPDASHGLVLLGRSVEDGLIQCDVRMPKPSPNCGAFIVFRANGQSAFYAAGLGGWESAYTLLEGHNLSTTRLASAGNIENLEPDRPYKVRVVLDGQRIQLSVDDVRVIDYDRLPASTGTGPSAVTGAGLGLFSFRGSEEVHFGPLIVDDRRPNAFIAMQFSEPYNEVYRDALRPLIEEIGYEPMRVDELSHPGVILNDIWTQLTEASVVIADVTEANPNVYYEIGVAHALRKPTVLLAQRGTKLPFDVGHTAAYSTTTASRAGQSC